MFDTSTLIKLFLDDRDLLSQSPDRNFVIYKFDRGNQFEFRVEKNFEPMHRFYLEKNDRVFDRLKNYLVSVNLYERENK